MKSFAFSNIICFLFSFILSNDLTNIASLGLLLKKAIGNNLTCIFVNTGLLRKNEANDIKKIFRKKIKLNLVYVDASKIFFKKLINVENPEKKRKIIGSLFIKIFEK